MIRVAIILAAASALLHAQSGLVKRGAEIFSATCAGAYCHGVEASGGRAPQLAGRTLFGVILNGRAAAGMPGFSQQLKSEDIEAVTQYVLSLSGSTPANPSGPVPPPEAE